MGHPARTEPLASIVLVEDDSAVSRVLRRLMEEEGYAVVEAGRSEEVMTHCRGHHVDLAIVDTFLPGGDGLLLMTRLRAEFPQVKILALTSEFLSPDNRQRVVQLDVDALLDKPFPPSELLRLVRGIAAHRS